MTYNDRDYNAVYALNSYIWKLLEANMGWTKAQYKQGSPIIPSGQQPELKDLGLPFIVYGSALQPVQHLYALRTESVSYTIYSKDPTEANQIVNLLTDVFERQDEAAAFVNEHTDADPRGRKISFGTIRATMSEHAEPAEEEGGYTTSFILLEAKYTTRNPEPVLGGFTYP